MPATDDAEVYTRLASVARMLDLPRDDVAAAVANEDALIDLADKYGISLDWLFLGRGAPLRRSGPWRRPD